MNIQNNYLLFRFKNQRFHDGEYIPSNACINRSYAEIFKGKFINIRRTRS